MSGYNSHSQRQDLRTTLRVDPSLVLRSKILELSQQELSNAIETELADNPALERLDDDSEPITDEAVLKAVAPIELKYTKDDHEFERSLPQDHGDVVDWVDLAATQNSLREHVRAQLTVALPSRLENVAHYVTDSLNEKGYLEASTEELALALNVSMEEVEMVLAVLRQCEPAGVGARDVVDCLLLQLKDGETLEHKLARTILKDFMDDLIARRTGKISRRFKVLPNVVEAAFAEILALNPNPAEGFSTTSSSLMLSPHVSIQPDLVISRTELGWEIEPRGADPTLFRVSDAYRGRLKELKAKSNADPDEKAHLSEYAGRAEQFIQSLKDRRKTLRRIGEYLVERQMGFVSTGQYEFLASLTRTTLAKEIGLHESTISRATMGKFVQIATGDIVPFEVFFKPALRVQKMIEEILERENPGSPLSDEQIAKMLEAKGVFVARRTVNKYRDRTRMLNSRVRRSA